MNKFNYILNSLFNPIIINNICCCFCFNSNIQNTKIDSIDALLKKSTNSINIIMPTTAFNISTRVITTNLTIIMLTTNTTTIINEESYY